MEKEIKEGFKFLKGDIKIHPTTGINLEYLKKQNAVCVVVFDNDMKNVYLVEQYRPGSDSNMLEIVAGLIDEGEEPKEAVLREFNEETGFTVDDIEEFVEMNKPQYVSPGYTTEMLYYYAIRLKKNASPKKQHLDFGEDVKLVKLPLEKALSEANDTKTLLALLYFLEFNV